MTCSLCILHVCIQYIYMDLNICKGKVLCSSMALSNKVSEQVNKQVCCEKFKDKLLSLMKR